MPASADSMPPMPITAWRPSSYPSSPYTSTSPACNDPSATGLTDDPMNRVTKSDSMNGCIDSNLASSSSFELLARLARPSTRRAWAASCSRWTRSTGGSSRKDGGGGGDPLAALGVAVLVRRLVRVELDAAGGEQGAIDVVRARPRREIGETPEGRDVDVEPSADDRRERRRAVGPVHHVPRLGERASPRAFERWEEHRRRQRRHDVGHDLAGVAAREHGVVRVERRIELVCGHAALPMGPIFLMSYLLGRQAPSRNVSVGG